MARINQHLAQPFGSHSHLVQFWPFPSHTWKQAQEETSPASLGKTLIETLYSFSFSVGSTRSKCSLSISTANCTCSSSETCGGLQETVAKPIVNAINTYFNLKRELKKCLMMIYDFNFYKGRGKQYYITECYTRFYIRKNPEFQIVKLL